MDARTMNPVQIYGHKGNPLPGPEWTLAGSPLFGREPPARARPMGRSVHEAVPFLRTLQRNTNQAARTWPSLHAAYALYAQPPDLRRWELEARLLTTEPFEQVASKCLLTAAAVEAYHGVFFHVRERLGARCYILNEVISPKIH